VNVPFQGAIPGDVKKTVNPELLGRALWWFRWGAMLTLLAGLALFTQLYMYTPGVGFGPTELLRTTDGVTGRGAWIMMGVTIGIFMWINVWFVVWPAQRRILQAVRDGQTVDPKLPKRALHVSRVNAYLSGPLLFAMLAPNHYGAFNHFTAFVGDYARAARHLVGTQSGSPRRPVYLAGSAA
jgi:uncharacterized membrane protein